MGKPLKVYYCNKCGTRMPLYYKEEKGFRDDNWKYCISCKSPDIQSQIEEWDTHREMAAKRADTLQAKVDVRRSAVLYGREQKKDEINDLFKI